MSEVTEELEIDEALKRYAELDGPENSERSRLCLLLYQIANSEAYYSDAFHFALVREIESQLRLYIADRKSEANR